MSSNLGWAHMATNEEPTYVWREIRTQEELETALSLRYQVYNATPGLARFSSLDATSELDVDRFDAWSRHFGLFRRVSGNGHIVGTMRITSDEPSPLALELRGIAGKHPSLVSHISGIRPAPLPMLSYLVQATELRRRYDVRVERVLHLAEPGRLCLDPGLRVQAGRHGLRLSHFMIECALAHGWNIQKLDEVFMDCEVHLAPLYERFGFRPLSGISSVFQSSLGIEIAVLHATPATAPERLRNHISALARHLETTGEARLDSHHPSPTAQCAA